MSPAGWPSWSTRRASWRPRRWAELAFATRAVRREVVTLGDVVSAREVVVCALAMFVMWEMEPRKFRSDDAFRMQLARRVRRLTEANAAHYFDHIAGKGKRVYRDVAPREQPSVRWLAGGDAGRIRGYYRFSRVGRPPVSFPRRPPTWGFFGPYPILQGGSEVCLGGPP